VTVEDVRKALGLEPLGAEGGFFAETYRSDARMPATAFGIQQPGERSLASGIYYLLTANTFSAWHRLACDELYHFYLGDPVEVLLLDPNGPARAVSLGLDLAAGMRPQALVRRGIWQGSRLVVGGRFALLGTTTSPGFDRSDFELGDRRSLLAAFPAYREWILALTR
jgi:predicted cupin superfamily sugar epimerase